MPKYLGSHITLAEGLPKLLELLDSGFINAAQFHPSPPQMWLKNRFTDKTKDKFRSIRQHKQLDKIFFHGIYLINLASPDKDLVNRSLFSLEAYLELLHEIDGAGVVFHAGSITDRAREEEGLKRVANAISKLLDSSVWKDKSILLEVSAGKGHVVGSKLEHFAKIIELLNFHKSIGIALDTQHLWASGYNLKANLDALVSELRSLKLLERLDLIHINDSKTALGSHVDRHENLGEGELGLDFFSRLFKVKEFEQVSFVLETPAVKSLEGVLNEVKKCLKLARFEFFKGSV